MLATWTDSLDPDVSKLEHLNAQRTMEFNPSEHISAHKRTERTITTFASNMFSCG
ncbi:hypothetical protein LguiA_013484 [Lonicera macranthoides]